ncbi:hypothetical protein J6590_004777 [Homalodisca vitripennis]|nr:hypothetical protein J6590_004777 [Homalodisca vitripennis]
MRPRSNLTPHYRCGSVICQGQMPWSTRARGLLPPAKHTLQPDVNFPAEQGMPNTDLVQSQLDFRLWTLGRLSLYFLVKRESWIDHVKN